MGILSFFRRQKPKTATTAEPSPQKEHLSAAGVPSVGPARAPLQSDAGGRPHAIIVQPVVTEKSSFLQSKGQYTFRVARDATKQDVRRAVEAQFRVHVTGVGVITVPPKTRRRGRTMGEVSGYRKAVVTLRSGEQIDMTKELR